MTNRFDVIVDCNGSTDLIDKTNELTTIPLGFNLTELNSEEIGKIREWIDFLNNKENYSTKKRILFTIEEAYESERTQIGKNVLKQLLEAIQ